MKPKYLSILYWLCILLAIFFLLYGMLNAKLEGILITALAVPFWFASKLISRKLENEDQTS